MAERTYRVRVARGEMQFEAEGDKAFVLAMPRRLGLSLVGDHPGIGDVSYETEALAARSRSRPFDWD
jgi:hypothetical protein